MATGYDGHYAGIVIDADDPLGEQRLLVRVPAISEDTVWALRSVGSDTSSTPAVGEEVAVTFEHGDTDHPIWERAGAGFVPEHQDLKWGGRYRAWVVDDADPEDRSRLAVRVPEVDDTASVWADPGTADVDPRPGIGSEVWIEYEGGDPAYPRWVGRL